MICQWPLKLNFPTNLSSFPFPPGVAHRLQQLLDKQDEGSPLTEDEKSEAEGLVRLAEQLSLLKLRARRIGES